MQIRLIDREGNLHLILKHELMASDFFKTVFEAQPNLPAYHISANAETVNVFVAFLRQSECEEIDDVYDALCFACSIDSYPFARFCIQLANSFSIPPELTEIEGKVVSRLVQVIPLRTLEQYKAVLTPARAELSPRIPGYLKIGLYDKTTSLIYRPLPIPLFLRKATMSIMSDISGNRVTAILSQDKWIPVDVFGPEFDAIKSDIKNIHLCFNRYVIYENGRGDVMKKNLQTNTPPRKVLGFCKFFRSMYNELYVVTHQAPLSGYATAVFSDHDAVYRWDHNADRFAMTFSHPDLKIVRVYKTCEDSVLTMVLENGAVGKLTNDGNLFMPSKCNEAEFVKRCDDCRTTYINEDASMVFTGRWVNAKFDHIGYNLLEIKAISNLERVFETTVYDKQWGKYTKTSTNLHGEVVTICDVLLDE